MFLSSNETNDQGKILDCTQRVKFDQELLSDDDATKQALSLSMTSFETKTRQHTEFFKRHTFLVCLFKKL